MCTVTNVIVTNDLLHQTELGLIPNLLLMSLATDMSHCIVCSLSQRMVPHQMTNWFCKEVGSLQVGLCCRNFQEVAAVFLRTFPPEKSCTGPVCSPTMSQTTELLIEEAAGDICTELFISSFKCLFTWIFHILLCQCWAWLTEAHYVQPLC